MSQQINRHASNLELFLDLAFVFSVTQVTGFVADDPTIAGVAKGALLGFVVWWQWTAFTWAGTAIDFQADTKARLIVLAMIPALLVMAISVPQALDGQPLWFAAAYFVLQLFVTALQADEAWRDPLTRASFVRFVPLAAVAPSVVLVGAFFDGNARVAVWTGGVVVMIASGFAATEAEGRKWSIDPTHFSERHGLFMIITLGEILVAIGATASAASADGGLDTSGLLAIALTATMTIVHWWCYFGFIPAVFERALEAAHGAGQGNIARDVGSFGHFVLVFGLILYAVVAKHIVAHPADELARADQWMLMSAVMFFVGGQLAIQFRLIRRLSGERLLVVGAMPLVPVVSPYVPAVAVIGAVVCALGVMSIAVWRKFRATEMGREIFAG